MTHSETAAPISALHGLTWTACMAALIAVGAYLHIPLGGMPFSMQPLFVFLAGFVLGPAGGALAVVLYWIAGIAGLPVFVGGTAGLFHFLTPTGGFLLGFIYTAVACGMASQRRKALDAPAPGFVVTYLWGVAGILGMYVPGTLWLKAYLGESASLQGTALVMLPFFISDFVKLFAAVAAYRFLVARRLAPR